MYFKGDKTTSFGGEVKPSAHVVRFYTILKISAVYDKHTALLNLRIFVGISLLR
jgi:hypothetical protein